MKIRSGFVSNSSSSSFLIFTGEPVKSADDLLEWLTPCDTMSVEEVKKNKKTRECVQVLKSLQRKGQISQKHHDHIIGMMQDSDFTLGKPYDTYLASKTVAKRIWEKSDGVKKPRYHRAKTPEDSDHPINVKYRQLYEIDDWREQLYNKQSYLYNVIRDNIKWSLRCTELDSEQNHGDRHPYMWNRIGSIEFSTFAYSSIEDNEERSIIKETILKLVDQLTDYTVNNILEEVDKDSHLYMIEWCTDDGASDDIDSLGRAGKITRSAWLVFRDEHS